MIQDSFIGAGLVPGCRPNKFFVEILLQYLYRVQDADTLEDWQRAELLFKPMLKS